MNVYKNISPKYVATKAGQAKLLKFMSMDGIHVISGVDGIHVISGETSDLAWKFWSMATHRYPGESNLERP